MYVQFQKKFKHYQAEPVEAFFVLGVSRRKVKKTGLRIKSIRNNGFDR